MAKFDKKRQALALRKEGQSVGSIAKALAVSKSTVSVWCCEIVLTTQQHTALQKLRIAAGHRGRMRGAEMNKLKKAKVIHAEAGAAIKEIGTLKKRDVLFLASALYWAEGAKTGPNFIFVNSDPATIQLMCYFLAKQLKVTKDRIRPTVQINAAHQSRIEKVISFWSKTLAIPESQFAKPYFVHTNLAKKYDNFEEHFGTLRLRVSKSSVLQYRMLGYISALRAQNMSADGRSPAPTRSHEE